MSKVAVITDTDSSLPAELAAAYDIRQVPQSIHFGQETFLSSIEIDDERLFARIDQEGKLPKTAAPAPGQFAEAYRTAFDAGAEQILCFCVSSTVSGTYNAALTASELFAGRDITVVDTQTLSMAQGFMALCAAEALRAGAGKDEALAQALELRGRTHLFAALSTLKYIAMSGRVGHLAAGLASLLDVKPILSMQNGQLDLLERVRTRHKAWLRVAELAAQAAQDKPIERAAILHVCAAEEARQFGDLLRSHISLPLDVLYAPLTPGLSVHTGAGLVGIVLVTAR